MQSILPKQKFFLAAAIVLGMGLSLAEPAYAAGSNMPWEGPLTKFFSLLKGLWPRFLAQLL